MSCLESVTELAKVAEVPNTVTAGIIDAPALLHMIKPDKDDTFETYRGKITNYGKLKLAKVAYLSKTWLESISF